jgi:hypothetical protein
MKISVETEAIRDASAKLREKAGEMRDAVQTADNAVGPLREMTSPRIEQDIVDWEDIKKAFLANLENLVAAAEELYKAAEANDIANQKR